jgi:nucleoside-diphosphate-sugar epimerase
MKIAILGASGGCGQHLVSQAVEQKHDVRAIVRSADWKAPPGVDVFRGALTDGDFLAESLKDCEVVISALGLRLKSIAPWAKPESPDFLQKSSAAILAALKKTGINRLMAISAGGAGDSAGMVPLAFRLFIKSTALRYVYPHLEAMERTLLQSGLDVCIPRPTGLTDGPVSHQVKVVTSMRGRATISRADVADWMLAQLTSKPFLTRTPIITVTGV